MGAHGLIWSLFGLLLSISQYEAGRFDVVVAIETAPGKCSIFSSANESFLNTDANIDCVNAENTFSHFIVTDGSNLQYYEWDRKTELSFLQLKVIQNVSTSNVGPLLAINDNQIFFIDVNTNQLKLYNIETNAIRAFDLEVDLSRCNRVFLDLLKNKLLYAVDDGDGTIFYESSLKGGDAEIRSRIWSFYFDYDDISQLLYYCASGEFFKLVDGSSLSVFTLGKDFLCNKFVVRNGTFALSVSNGITYIDMHGVVLQTLKFTTSEKEESVKFFLKVKPTAFSSKLTESCSIKGCTEFCLPNGLNSEVECLCPSEIAGGKQCLKESTNMLVFSAVNSVFELSLDVPTPKENLLFTQNVGNIDSVIYNHRSGHLFYTLNDASLGGKQTKFSPSTVYQCSSTQCTDRVMIGQAPPGTGLIEATAFDWISSNLYFTDNQLSLAVMRLSHKREEHPVFGKVLHTKESIKHSIINKVANSDQTNWKMRGIAVDPVEGFLFIGDYGYSDLLYRCDLDGENVRRLEITNLYWPNGLTVDISSRTLFVIDGEKLQLHQLDYYGNNHKIIHQFKPTDGSNPANTLARYGSKFFISFRFVALIEVYDNSSKNTESAIDVSYTHNKAVVNSMTVISGKEFSKIRNGTNVCDINNGNCSHFCFANPKLGQNFRTCECPDSMQLMKGNQQVCLSDHVMFLYSTDSSAGFLSPTVTKNNKEVPCDFSGLEVKGSVVYDNRLRALLFIAGRATSNTLSSIYRCDLDSSIESSTTNQDGFSSGSHRLKVAPYEVMEDVDSEWMAYDWSSRLVFWVDRHLRMILSMSINGEYKRVIVRDLDNVCCLVSRVPYLYFFADGKLMRATISSNWKNQIKPKLLTKLNANEMPKHLSVDSTGRILFWLSALGDAKEFGMKRISAYEPNAEKTSVLSWPSELQAFKEQKLPYALATFVNGSKIFVFLPQAVHVFDYIFQTDDFSVLQKHDVIQINSTSGFVSIANILPSTQFNTSQCSMVDQMKCDQLCFSDFAIIRDVQYRHGSCGCEQSMFFDESKQYCMSAEYQVQYLADSTILAADVTRIEKPAVPLLKFPQRGYFAGSEKLDIIFFAFDVVTSHYYLVGISNTEIEAHYLLKCDKNGLKVGEIELKIDKIKGLKLDPIGRFLLWYSTDNIFVYSLIHEMIVQTVKPVYDESILVIMEVDVFYGKNRLVVIYQTSETFISMINLSGESKIDIPTKTNPRVLTIDHFGQDIAWIESGNEVHAYNWANSRTHFLEEKLRNLEQLKGNRFVNLEFQGFLVSNHLIWVTDRGILQSWSFSATPLELTGEQDLFSKDIKDIKPLISLKGPDKAESKWCTNAKCSHFCVPNVRCECPMDYILKTVDGKNCIKIDDSPSCFSPQKPLKCSNLGIAEKGKKCPLVVMCSAFENDTCAEGQQTCYVGQKVSDESTVGNDIDYTDSSSGKKVCYKDSFSNCDKRPDWCPCIAGGMKSRKKDESFVSIIGATWLSVFGCLMLILAFALIISTAIYRHKRSSSAKTTKSNTLNVDRTSVSFSKVTNDIKITPKPINTNHQRNNLYIDTSASETRRSSSNPKLDGVRKKGNCESTATSAILTPRRSKKIQNNLQVPQNSIKSTSVLSSSCATLNNVCYIGPPPPTPTPDAAMYSFEPQLSTMCEDCIMRQNMSNASMPGGPMMQHSGARKKSWNSWRKGRHLATQVPSPHVDHNCKGFQSGEESEPLFMPKPQSPGCLPSGSRFSDFYPSHHAGHYSSHSHHHNTLPHGGKFYKRRRFIMDELVTYKAPPRPSHHHHAHVSGPPPPPACTPLSGSQEIACATSFLPPSPVSDRTSSMVYVVRQVQLGNDPPPSPVSTA